VTEWRSPAELVEDGLSRSRLVLMNEAHDGYRRCIRTREVGRSILPVAHDLGVRHLGMEALDPAIAAQANTARVLPVGLGAYLGQSDMRALVNATLDLGWTLHAYEADFAVWPHGAGPEDDAAVNWREDQQARNLAAVVQGLPKSERVIGWCGNGHLTRRELAVSVNGETRTWTPMGSLVEHYCDIRPYAIDQAVSVSFNGQVHEWLGPFAEFLRRHGGTAGFLADETPDDLAWLGGNADAYLLSLENALVE